MAFVKVYIHFIWSTKNREPFLDSPVLRKNLKKVSLKQRLYDWAKAQV